MVNVKNLNRKYIISAIIGLLIVIIIACLVGGAFITSSQMGVSSQPAVTSNHPSSMSVVYVTEPSTCDFTQYKDPKEFHRIYYK